ncbi:MAG: hypothetical protein ACM32I_07265 [Nitrospirota bacterium]
MKGSRLFNCSVLFLAVMMTACGYYRIVPKAIDLDKLALPSQKIVEPSDPSWAGNVWMPQTERPVRPSTHIRRVYAPVKAHLKDGGVILFPDGFRVAGNLLKGGGEMSDFMRQIRTPAKEVALTDVALLEYYEKDIRPVSVVSTIGVAAVGIAALLGIAFLAFV